MRSGILLEKIGMSSLFSGKGVRIPVTLLKIEECQVIAQKNTDKHGYDAVVLGYGKIKLNKLSKPLKGFYSKISIEGKRILKEFRVTPENMLEVGQSINVDHFIEGQYVDVRGISIGKGFAGVMKRHNFRGLEASHGVSITHRSHGSTGGRQDPGKVFKNKKMAGHLGCERVTIQNLKVVRIDLEKNILVVKGSVPGAKGSMVYVNDAIKR